ncbi:MAG: Asp-tRNA(Asn)/Glu-tRNA(Gln) amidotransferase subunit GatC [Planctomycetota bacterium]
MRYPLHDPAGAYVWGSNSWTKVQNREGGRISPESDATNSAGRPVVDAALVRKTARLARLELSDEEIPGLVDHLEKILDLVETLRSVEIPAGHLIDGSVRSVSVDGTRRDQPHSGDDPGGPRDSGRIGENAPDWRDGTFVTPRVVG